MKLLPIVIITILLFSCTQPDNFSKHIDHWEINRTFKSYNQSTLNIDTAKNEYQVAKGYNQVLIVVTEISPVFKPGKELTDLQSSKTLLIELDSSDNFVTAFAPSKSKLFQFLTAFSPEHGIKPLKQDNKIELTRKDSTVWTIDSDIKDFVFKAELNFATNQELTNNFITYY